MSKETMKLNNLGKIALYANFGPLTRDKSSLQQHLHEWKHSSCLGQKSFFVLNEKSKIFNGIEFLKKREDKESNPWRVRDIIEEKEIKVVINNSFIEIVIPQGFLNYKCEDTYLFKIPRIEGYFLSRIQKDGNLMYIAPI